MIPFKFPEANSRFGPPNDLEESQCFTIDAYQGQVNGGSVDGCQVVVTAWLTQPWELKLLSEGKPLFLSFIGGLPPHFVSMSFEEATHPA